MGEDAKPGRPKVLVRRHFLEIEEKTRQWLDEKIERGFELVQLKAALGPVSATLGNPVAFPIVAGLGGAFIAVLYLKLRFPDKQAQAESEVRKAAEAIAEAIERSKPDPPIGERDPSTLDRLIQAYTDFLMRIWNDPLFGFGGAGPFHPRP